MKKRYLKKMSYEELGAQLKAVNSLLYYYLQGRNFSGTCKLCHVSKTYHPNAAGACGYCLWTIIEGENCGQFAAENFDSFLSVGFHTGRKEWHELRIPMLRRWGRIIQAEKDSRTCGGGG